MQDHNCCKISPKFLCSRCSETRYCSKACQASDWPNHKHVCKKKVDIENLLSVIWKIYLHPDVLACPSRKFEGKIETPGKTYWFFDRTTGPPIKSDHKTFWTTQECVTQGSSRMMTEQEFWMYKTMCCCEYFSVPLAKLLCEEFLSAKKSLRIRGQIVKNIRLIKSHVETDFNEQVACYGRKLEEGITPEMKVSSLVGKLDAHCSLGFWTENGQVWSVDFTAAQYGLFTKEREEYVHIERCETLENIDIEYTLNPPLFISDGKASSILGKSTYASFLCTYSSQDRMNESKGVFDRLYESLKRGLSMTFGSTVTK